MRWAFMITFSLLGCATAEEPFSRVDASGDSETSVPEDTATEDTGKPKDSSTDTGSPPTDSGPCKLVINEVQTGDGSSGSADFVEIHNGCSTSTSVASYKLVYRSATGTSDVVIHTFAAGTTVGSKGYLVLAGSAFSGASDGALSSGLAAAGASIALKTDTDSVLDSVAWGTGTGIYVEGTAAPAPGDSTPAKSIARTPNGADTDDNLTDFKVGTPTPGAPN